MQILHAGRYALSPAVGRAVGDQVADHAVHAARAVARAASSARSAISSRCAQLAQRRRLRRRRGHGLGGLSASTSSSSQRTNQRNDDWGGIAREPHALPGRDRARACARRSAAISSSSIACRCSISSKAAAAGTKSSRSRRRSKRPARRSSTPASAGTRRASRRSRRCVPRAAFAWVTRRLQGAKCAIPLITTNRINMPDVAEAHPRATATPTWCRWRGRCSPIRDGSRKARDGRARRDQHLHRLQPGVPRPRVREQARDLPGQSARVPRDRARDSPAATRRSASPSSARARRASPARRRWPSAATP